MYKLFYITMDNNYKWDNNQQPVEITYSDKCETEFKKNKGKPNTVSMYKIEVIKTRIN